MQTEILIILSCKVLVHLEILRCWISCVTLWVKTEVDGHLTAWMCQGSCCEVALCWVIWVRVWADGFWAQISVLSVLCAAWLSTPCPQAMR